MKKLIPVTARSKAEVCFYSFAGIPGSNPAGAFMSVSFECCVLSGRGHCDRLITRPEKSYRLSLSVVRCKINSLHQHWLGRRGQTKKININTELLYVFLFIWVDICEVLRKAITPSFTLRIEASSFPESSARCYNLHGVTQKKTVFFTVTFTRTQNIPKTKINIRFTLLTIGCEVCIFT